MKDTPKRPAADADPWAEACAEDLAAEQARRRARYGRQSGGAADELKKLADAIADGLDKLSSLGLPVAGPAAQATARQLVDRARSAVEPVVRRNPEVFEHLTNAGSELLAAFRAAVAGQEQPPGPGSARNGAGDEQDRGGPEGTSGGRRVDLD
ncbi:DUF5304 family protein [Streptomyces sp. TP-A0874]|uniref:DUF5304 family protein n=1 Tax=Streptomyces sp. TP-A0874 TaxID=549819 RepID=UPI0008533238|nr:DUF5304 family protein [Streptomyces sp. TP-A0874]